MAPEDKNPARVGSSLKDHLAQLLGLRLKKQVPREVSLEQDESSWDLRLASPRLGWLGEVSG